MKQKIYLITGLMASGKSTVSDLLAKSIEKCVHLRGDVFRKMIISGRENMSATPSAEAVRQLYLRYKLTADAARSLRIRAKFVMRTGISFSMRAFAIQPAR